MADSRNSNSVFTRQVQKRFTRAQEKVLQRLGKSEETKDFQFDQNFMNLQDQHSDAYRIYKDLKAYLNAVRVMKDASSRLFQSLLDVYDPDWTGADDLLPVVEGEDLLWNDYESKLRDQALITFESYISQFPDIREKVSKRNRKMVDYDSARHHLSTLMNSKKRDDIKIKKAEDEMKDTERIFQEINSELKVELPLLFDSRIGCYVAVFQSICSLRETFYREMTQNNLDLQVVVTELSAQHPDNSFTVKNFHRSGSLKRRSFRETLSPKSIRSFYEFHMSYSPRSSASLRRENSVSSSHKTLQRHNLTDDEQKKLTLSHSLDRPQSREEMLEEKGSEENQSAAQSPPQNTEQRESKNKMLEEEDSEENQSAVEPPSPQNTEQRESRGEMLEEHESENESATETPTPQNMDQREGGEEVLEHNQSSAETPSSQNIDQREALDTSDELIEETLK